MGVRNIEGTMAGCATPCRRTRCSAARCRRFDDDTGEPVFETEEFAPEVLPFIVVIVDEMADLMMVAGKEIEACIQRLAQMARASGIHLIMATQRPSVDVITGTIKANFPTRISFQVTSKIDSRTILGEQGAEQLLGMGDMLYMAGGARITRCHGPFVSDEEVEEVVTHLKQFGPPDYVGKVLDGPDDDKAENIDAVLGCRPAAIPMARMRSMIRLSDRDHDRNARLYISASCDRLHKARAGGGRVEERAGQPATTWASAISWCRNGSRGGFHSAVLYLC